MNFLQLILFPFSVLYDAITRLRNHLFNRGLRTSFSFDLPIISVGNLSVGGTGKTPAVEYLIRLLQERENLVTLSRGYGRRTRGYRVAAESDTALSLGDEPFQLYRKFPNVQVTVGEDRAMAIPEIIAEFPDTSCILLDDAFQHRTVKPALSVLLTPFSRPFYTDYILPSGRLRESRKNACRADIIIITKCPDQVAPSIMEDMKNNVKEYAPGVPVFFSKVNYAGTVAHSGSQLGEGSPVILVTGIANANDLKKYVDQHYILKEHIEYADHHRFSQKEVMHIKARAMESNAVVLTTEKDYVRLAGDVFKGVWDEVPLHYLPISMEFLKDGAKFDKQVLQVFP